MLGALSGAGAEAAATHGDLELGELLDLSVHFENVGYEGRRTRGFAKAFMHSKFGAAETDCRPLRRRLKGARVWGLGHPLGTVIRLARSVAHQLGLLDWIPPAPTNAKGTPARARGRGTTAGLAPGIRIRVRRSETRSADTGTILDLRRTTAGLDMVQYRSDRNGGVYLVRVDRVRISRSPRSARARKVRRDGCHAAGADRARPRGWTSVPEQPARSWGFGIVLSCVYADNAGPYTHALSLRRLF